MTQYTAIPQPGYIIVEPIKSEEFNKTELATLDNDKEHASIGKVLSVGGVATFANYDDELDTNVKVGDVIAYIQYSESPIKLNGTELHQVRFDQVTSIIVETN